MRPRVQGSDCILDLEVVCECPFGVILYATILIDSDALHTGDIPALLTPLAKCSGGFPPCIKAALAHHMVIMSELVAATGAVGAGQNVSCA
ncbi:hypothetical protein N798_05570 [Knoellia flava TL1]|uniref:Uncharacterized protein n=1 Tax=Knoellia flava TL1 TaxID=1385518 RepID=A0ABR4XFQ8_9MICO|nr:hypothetical protein N798_05570 [Knoellia flava TL1]